VTTERATEWELRPLLCHPACPACPGLPWGVPWDRSVAKWRDLQFSQPASDPNGSSALPFVIPSEVEGSAVPPSQPQILRFSQPASDPNGSSALPFVIPPVPPAPACRGARRGTGAKRSGGICGFFSPPNASGIRERLRVRAWPVRTGLHHCRRTSFPSALPPD